MDQHLIFLLLGLANGAVFASLAMSLVVTYRSSGVLNFATGTIALYGAYTYAFLRNGQLLVLIPGLPEKVRLGSDLSFWPATLLTLLITALLGLVLYLLVFRPLRAAPAVAKAVASIGVMLVLTGLMAQRLGTSPLSVDAILPTEVWTLGSIRISSDRFWFAAAVLGIAIAVTVAFRFTRFGLHTRAAAETEKGALVSGIAPDRIAAANWMISAAIAAISGILIAPIVPLVPISYTLFIVPALAAAVLGRFQYVIPAVLGGLLIGMLQSEMTFLRSQNDWLPSSGLSELVPLVLILLVLVVRAKPLPSRGVILQRALGRAPRPQRIVMPTVFGTVAGALAVILLQHNWRAAMVTSFIFAIICLSSVVVTGFAGQVSLAQLTLAGVAGFLLTTLTTEWSIPFPIAPILAALGATVVGVIVGLPALRVRGLFVAVVTLAMAYAVQAVWFRNADYVPAEGRDVTGPKFVGLDLRSRVGIDYPRLSFCLLVLAVLVIVAVSVAVLRRSRLGSAMLAVRANERSAAGAGINVVRVKILAFAIAAFIAGIGGAMLGYKQGNLTDDPFNVLIGIGVFATAYLAGITSVSGGILAGMLAAGGIVFYATNQWLDLGDWYGTVTGVALVLTVVLNPEGIVGPWHSILEKMRSRRITAVEPAPADAQVAEVPPAAPADPELLSLRDVHVAYGGVVAVDNLSFDVAEGSIVALIGPNGAGKTTLLDAISGFATASGSTRLGGRELGRLPPHRRIRAGLGRTFQQIELYDDLSVRENIAAGLALRQKRRTSQAHAERVLTLLELNEVADRPAGELSQGRRQLVSIARALVGEPRVILLDEPASGLDTTESKWLGERLRRIRDSGVTILMVDHDMHLVLNLCEQIHVLDFGRLIASGTPAVVKADRRVAEAYLGSTHAEPATVTS